MTAAVDRMWDVTDAVLRWLYAEHCDGRGDFRTIEPSEIEKSVHWAASEITDEEINRSNRYLLEQGYITGMELADGSIFGVTITSVGLNQAATGMSVRPGPAKEANTTGVTNHYTFHNHGPSNNAVNSNDFTQTITVEQKSDQIVAVAEALEKLASESATGGDEARQLASEIREAASEPEDNKSKLRAMLGSAIGMFTLAAGTAAGEQATQLAVNAIQSLGA